MDGDFKNCKGCPGDANEGACYNIRKFNSDRSCPCTECIVKIMCSDWCYKWREWRLTKEGARTYANSREVKNGTIYQGAWYKNQSKKLHLSH
jgi:hypothetical protein